MTPDNEHISIDAVIGKNLKKLRKGRGTKHRPEYSQSRVAEYLRYYTEETWDQSQVSDAESGKRRFTVVDLFTIASIFQVSPLRLLHSGEECVIWFGRTGVEEGHLLYQWMLGADRYGKVNPDELQTTWREPWHHAKWATDTTFDNLTTETGDTNGDD